MKQNLSFIKTVNSPVDTTDFAVELEDRGIWYNQGDNGVYVRKEDLSEAESILMEMEEEVE